MSLPVLADPECACREELAPDALVDAILAKRNLGTKIDDAPIVVGVGPGFTAGEDCHAVVETMRGHTLGRVIYSGSALPNTNIPGLIGGFAGERVLRAPCDGIFTAVHRIGDTVEEGETIGFVEGQPMKCTISGVLRGVLDDGVPVKKGMKSGDVDPRCKPEYCTTISDKALAVGGGVVEAVLYLSAKATGQTLICPALRGRCPIGMGRRRFSHVREWPPLTSPKRTARGAVDLDPCHPET